ncbi:MAG: hypothetical protein ACR2PL_11660 [Dehalococcoidia bacterium]
MNADQPETRERSGGDGYQRGAGSGIETSSKRLAITAQPFEHHRRLRSFIEAIQALPGVQDCRPCHFLHGALTLELRYDGELALEQALAKLAGFPAQVDAALDGTVDLVLEPRTAT